MCFGEEVDGGGDVCGGAGGCINLRRVRTCARNWDQDGNDIGLGLGGHGGHGEAVRVGGDGN